jgi:hypothetical protein
MRWQNLISDVGLADPGSTATTWQALLIIRLRLQGVHHETYSQAACQSLGC